jgi:hypothetical protein
LNLYQLNSKLQCQCTHHAYSQHFSHQEARRQHLSHEVRYSGDDTFSSGFKQIISIYVRTNVRTTYSPV